MFKWTIKGEFPKSDPEHTQWLE